VHPLCFLYLYGLLEATRLTGRKEKWDTKESCIIDYLLERNMSRDSSVGIALGYGLDDRGSRVRFPARLGIFHFTSASRTALEPTQPPIQWVSGALSLGVKRPGREADHSPPSSAEVKNAWSYTSTPPIRLHGVVLSEAQGQLYLLLERNWYVYGLRKERYCQKFRYGIC
jgi:hypothetical protein